MDFTFTPFTPPAELAPILRRSFFAKGRIAYRSDKILPNGLVAAVFNRGEPHQLGKSEVVDGNPQYAHSWLQGVQTTPIFNTPQGETHVLGLVFEPIGFHALFGVDMRSLADRIVDARDVLPSAFIAEIEAVLGDAAEEETHRAIYDALLAYAPEKLPSWLEALYAAIRASHGSLRLMDAYDRTGRSPRHVSARFKTAVGVAPKVLTRIYRLAALLEEVEPAEKVNWTTLAHRFGFFDQAHFNREFRRFSGLHPNQYLMQRRRDLPQLGRGDSVHFAPQA